MYDHLDDQELALLSVSLYSAMIEIAKVFGRESEMGKEIREEFFATYWDLFARF